MMTNTLTPDLLQRMDAYWRATNYPSVAQISTIWTASTSCVSDREEAEISDGSRRRAADPLTRHLAVG